MRKTKFTKNEHYHVCGRGFERQRIFRDDDDYMRFLFLILHLQKPLSLKNISRFVAWFKKDPHDLAQSLLKKSDVPREIAVVAFCIMPNHFHILLRNDIDGGISLYMHRILTAYSAYFNRKYKHSGHVFQGPFVSVPIETNTQLLHVSAYIHKNPTEIGWKGKEHLYPWSSYQDYVNVNRWGDLLDRRIILEQFDTISDYRFYVTTSLAKTDQ